MSKTARIRNLLMGLVMILLGGWLSVRPEEGFLWIAAFLCISLLAYGIGQIVYYFRMARHMVGGRMVLYRGGIILDVGMMTIGMSRIPRLYILLYLVIIHLVSGVIDVAHGLDARRQHVRFWFLYFLEGGVLIVLALGCLVHFRSTEMLVQLYCTGLFTTAAIRIGSAFSRPSIIYIP